jgi:chromosome segregation ATPase
MKKIYLNEATERLSTSRTTIYKHLKTLGISLQKDGNKSFFTQDQFLELEAKIKGNVSTSNTNYKQVNTLKNKIKEQEIEINTLKIKQNKKNIETKISDEKYRTLEIQNAKIEGRAETLEMQNNKLHLTSGGLAEQVKNLVIKNQKLIEITDQNKKSGIFQHIFTFWGNNLFPHLSSILKQVYTLCICRISCLTFFWVGFPLLKNYPS